MSLLSKLRWYQGYQDCIGILGYRNAGINSAGAGMKKEIWLLVLLIALFYKTQIQPKLHDRVKEQIIPSSREESVAGAKLFQTRICQPDEVLMVRIPGKPPELDAFYMDTTEVTVGQFQQFLQETNYPFSSYRWESIYLYSPTENHPMIHVTWHEAVAYAEWAGKRLPTEAEWEHAARGGLVGKKYSWEESPARNHANFRGIGGQDQWEKVPAPVGSFEPNGYGLYDMAGNVWEWCQDWRDQHQVTKVVRGGSWYNRLNSLQVTSRDSDYPTDSAIANVGFRCVLGLRLEDWFQTQQQN